MKQISNGTVVRLSSWNACNGWELAKVHDMGLDPDFANYVTDEDRIYGGARPVFLSSDPEMYEIEAREYASPIVLDNGELVTLTSNGKTYKVVNMGRNGKFEYYQDILHFELVK